MIEPLHNDKFINDCGNDLNYIDIQIVFPNVFELTIYFKNEQDEIMISDRTLLYGIRSEDMIQINEVQINKNVRSVNYYLQIINLILQQNEEIYNEFKLSLGIVDTDIIQINDIEIETKTDTNFGYRYSFDGDDEDKEPLDDTKVYIFTVKDYDITSPNYIFK